MIEIKHAAMIGKELALAWSDGTESYLPFDLLRRACPCASCQGEPDAVGRVVRPQVPYTERSFELARFDPIGGYAIQLRFADGHGTGIYSFDYLRELAEAGV
jgi:DUF971 family protein